MEIKFTEAKVQCELYRQLYEEGYNVYPEVIIPLPSGRKLRSDLVVYRGDKFVGLVEVKNNLNKKKPNPNTRQYKKYMSSGYKFFYCMNMSDVKSVINRIKHYENGI